MRSFLAGPLLTDLYEITMAAGYWAHDIRERATFSVFVRNPDRKRNYFVAAGLETLLRELAAYRFQEDDLHYLKGLKLFDRAFLESLRRTVKLVRDQAPPEIPPEVVRAVRAALRKDD